MVHHEQQGQRQHHHITSSLLSSKRRNVDNATAKKNAFISTDNDQRPDDDSSSGGMMDNNNVLCRSGSGIDVQEQPHHPNDHSPLVDDRLATAATTNQTIKKLLSNFSDDNNEDDPGRRSSWRRRRRMSAWATTTTTMIMMIQLLFIMVLVAVHNNSVGGVWGFVVVTTTTTTPRRSHHISSSKSLSSSFGNRRAAVTTRLLLTSSSSSSLSSPFRNPHRPGEEVQQWRDDGGFRQRHVRSSVSSLLQYRRASFMLNVRNRKTSSGGNSAADRTTGATEEEDQSDEETSSSPAGLITANLNDPQVFKAVVQSLQLYRAAFGTLEDMDHDFIVPSQPPWPTAAWKVQLGNIQITNPIQLNIITKLNLTAGVNRKPKQPLPVVVVIPATTTTPTTITTTTVSSNNNNNNNKEVVTAAAAVGTNTLATTTTPKQQPPPQKPLVRTNKEGISPLQSSEKSGNNKMEEKTSSRKSDENADDELPPEFSDPSELGANDKRFRNVYLALATYQKLYGDLYVPQPFVVPKDDTNWPSELWGLRLGARVNAIRSQGTFVNTSEKRRNMLDQLGFVWTPNREDLGRRPGRRPDERTVPAGYNNANNNKNNNVVDASSPPTTLDSYNKKINADNDFDENDDDEDDDDNDAAGGSTGDRPSAVSSLEAIFGGSVDFGTDYLRSSSSVVNNNSKKDGNVGGGGTEDLSNLAAGALNWDLGGARMPENMGRNTAVLPALDATNMFFEDERTLEESMAEAAARAIEVNVIEEVGQFKRPTKGRIYLEIPWYNDDFGDDFVFEDVVEALTVYKNLYGDFSNFTKEGCDYTVPTPKEAVGFLGFENEQDDEDVDDNRGLLNTFGRGANLISSPTDPFDQNYNNENNNDNFGGENDGEDNGGRTITAEILRLQREVEQQQLESKRGRSPVTAAVYSNNYVDDDVDAWPEHLAGMRLARIVKRIKDGSLWVGHIPERRAQLDAIGFDWGNPLHFLDVPFEITFCCCVAYYLIRGDTFVDEDFVMLPDEPWPTALAGYPLGPWVHRLRMLQNYVEAYHPEKKMLLRDVDFMWDYEYAWPLGYREGEDTMETFNLRKYGHPDYMYLEQVFARSSRWDRKTDLELAGCPSVREIFANIRAMGPVCDISGHEEDLWWRLYHDYDRVKDVWHALKRRDQAFYLRNFAYPLMAAEHEDKYGPGLMKQVDRIMNDLVAGPPLADRSDAECHLLLQVLTYLRHEYYTALELKLHFHPVDEKLYELAARLGIIDPEVEPDTRYGPPIYWWRHLVHMEEAGLLEPHLVEYWHKKQADDKAYWLAVKNDKRPKLTWEMEKALLR